MRRYTILSGIAVLIAVLMVYHSRNSANRNSTIVVLCAPSLSGPMEELRDIFNRSDGNSEAMRVENTYRGSAELLAMYQISRIGEVLIAADVGYHDDFKAAGYCESTQALGQQFPCLIYRNVSQAEALSILRGQDSTITTSIPKPNHAAIGRRIASIVGDQQYDLLVDRAKVSRETVTQVAADVSSGIVDVGIAWSTSPQQFSGLQWVVPPAWAEHSSEIGASVLLNSPRSNAAQQFVNFLKSSDAREVFAKHGFASTIVSLETGTGSFGLTQFGLTQFGLTQFGLTQFGLTRRSE